MKYAFVNCNILNGKKDMVVESGKYILVDDGKITDIVAAGGADLSGYTVKDLKGAYVSPGLINMHVHLAGNGKPQKKQRDNAKLVKTVMSTALTRKIAYNLVCSYAKSELLSGVTTIRTMGGIADFDGKLRDEISAGKKIGPRILAANQGISVPGGHMAGSVAVAVTTPEEAKKRVEMSKNENIDLVKIMVTGGVLDAKGKGVPGELKM